MWCHQSHEAPQKCYHPGKAHRCLPCLPSMIQSWSSLDNRQRYTIGCQRPFWRAPTSKRSSRKAPPWRSLVPIHGQNANITYKRLQTSEQRKLQRQPAQKSKGTLGCQKNACSCMAQRLMSSSLFGDCSRSSTPTPRTRQEHIQNGLINEPLEPAWNFLWEALFCLTSQFVIN